MWLHPTNGFAKNKLIKSISSVCREFLVFDIFIIKMAFKFYAINLGRRWSKVHCGLYSGCYHIAVDRKYG